MTSTQIYKEYIELFISNIDANKQSKKTYQYNTGRFFEYLAAHGLSFDNLKKVDIINYKEYLEKNYSSYTASLRFTVVRMFFKYLEEENIYKNITNEIKKPSIKKGYTKGFLSVDQVNELIKAIDISTVKGLRDYAMINLMLLTGLRCVEVSRMNVKDLSEQYNLKGVFIQGKGRHHKDDFIRLLPEAIEPIEKYLYEMNIEDDNIPLFQSFKTNRGYRLQPLVISQLIKSYLIKAGINNKMFSAHSLRHTAASQAIMNGSDIYEVQLMMRHSSTNITQLYTKLIEANKRLENTPQTKLVGLYEKKENVCVVARSKATKEYKTNNISL